MLKELVTSKVREKILLHFFLEHNPKTHIRELARIVGTEINAVRRELSNLESAGLLKKISEKNKIFYLLEKTNPFYSDLLAICQKEFGIASYVIKCEKDIGKLSFGVLSKEFAEGRVSFEKDVDLALVGVLNMEKVKKLISEIEQKTKKEINWTAMSEEEFFLRKKRGDSFLIKILMEPRIIFLGDENKYCRID